MIGDTETRLLRRLANPSMGLGAGLGLPAGGSGLSVPALDLNFLSGALDSRITFTRGSAGTFVNSAGLIESAGTNVPRFDHDPVTLAPKGLLIEEARTNLLLHCNDLTNAVWCKSSATATKTAAGPDGVSNSASTLTATAENGYAYQSVNSAIATRILSLYVKRRTGNGGFYISQGATTGGDLVTNGGFGADTDWTKGTGWTISGGRAVATAVSYPQSIFQAISFIDKKAYKITVDVTVASGEVVFQLGSAPPEAKVLNATGSYSFYLTCGGSATLVIRAGGSGFTGTVDNVTVAEVAETDVTITTNWTRVETALESLTNPITLLRLATNGDAVDIAYVQQEVGGFATSVILTASTAVTRSADSATILGANFSNWFNRDEGTLLAVYSIIGQPGSTTVVGMDDGTTNNYHRILPFIGGLNGKTQVSAVSNDIIMAQRSIGSMHKTAYAYKTDDFAMSTDGGNPIVDTSGVGNPPITQAGIGSGAAALSIFCGHVLSVRYYRKRLANDALRSLTL